MDSSNSKNKNVVTCTSKRTGETKPLIEWARSSGVNYATLLYRVTNKGMNIDDAIEASKETPFDSVTDPVSGETYSLKKWSEILGIPYHTLYNRIANYKWPIDKVLHGEKFKTVVKKAKSKRVYKHIDLTGRRFGHLTVLRRADTDYVCMCNGKEKYEWKWVCQCDCPDKNIVEVIQHNLLNGHCTSCGCANTNNLIDITGQKFGHLTVIGRAPDKIVSGERVVHWFCECDCGNPDTVIVSGRNLRTGHTISCGCRIGGVTHGMKGTRIYNIYNSMMNRCYNTNDSAYSRYGARGIYICDEWYGYGDGFVNFYNWSIVNGYSDDLTIDRIDNDGPYAPWNCRWTTMKVQANNRRNNILITYGGETLTATQWAEKLGVNNATLIARHNKGWSDKDIIETPINYYIRIVTSPSSGESHTLNEWSVLNGIDSKTIYDRIFRLNWNIDVALTMNASNPEIRNHVGRKNRNVFTPQINMPVYTPAIIYTDILGNEYTQEEFESRQAILFD